MDAAWFGLLGVIVGGFISSLWAWLAIVRQEQTDAMVAARLVDEDLERLTTKDHERCAAANLALWVENRVALAKVLGEDEWRTVAGVYTGTINADDVRGVALARARLRPLVEGKRHVVPPRWRKKLSPS